MTQKPTLPLLVTALLSLAVIRAEGRPNILFIMSDDQKEWSKVWNGAEVQEQWTAELKEPAVGKFIKIGLPGTGTLHLNQVTIFGE
jgi:hypothetical protein